MPIPFADAADLYIADRNYYMLVRKRDGEQSPAAKDALRLAKQRMRDVSNRAAPKLYTSDEAARTKTNTVKDHVVPVSKIHDWILDGNPTTAEIQTRIQAHLAIAEISEEEDDLLDQAGLRQRMPNGWNWGGDILARYTQCKIKLRQIP